MRSIHYLYMAVDVGFWEATLPHTLRGEYSNCN
jgi:hypothetical protein